MKKCKEESGQIYKVNGILVTAWGFNYVLDKEKTPPSREHIEICKQWIEKWVDEQKIINTYKTSYGLKHLVEKLNSEENVYVTNGSFIVAAAELGFDVKRIGWNSPNAYFNMNFGRIDEILLEEMEVVVGHSIKNLEREITRCTKMLKEREEKNV